MDIGTLGNVLLDKPSGRKLHVGQPFDQFQSWFGLGPDLLGRDFFGGSVYAVAGPPALNLQTSRDPAHCRYSLRIRWVRAKKLVTRIRDAVEKLRTAHRLETGPSRYARA